MAIWEREDFLDASHFLISVPELFLSFLHPSSSFSNLYWKGIYLIACNKKTRPTLKSLLTVKTTFLESSIFDLKSKWHFSTVLNPNLKQWLWKICSLEEGVDLGNGDHLKRWSHYFMNLQSKQLFCLAWHS